MFTESGCRFEYNLLNIIQVNEMFIYCMRFVIGRMNTITKEYKNTIIINREDLHYECIQSIK